MFSKWRIKGIENYVFGEDGKLYRLPFIENKRSYGIREVKKQYPNRYRINDVWLSEKQMRHRIYRDESPILLFENEKDCPF